MNEMALDLLEQNNKREGNIFGESCPKTHKHTHILPHTLSFSLSLSLSHTLTHSDTNRDGQTDIKGEKGLTSETGA